ncbi:TolC family protein [Rufibacter glacialis]|uniref:TolC family protein n=1 Tax=Rufibacter glacialis TaxID=1259555 RepID=A0A5M8Q5Y8_9BACT|nr:TolC family protein [Rufibacter glacialis]KAA6430743.1 TolC family protein [Rufibacter glacialis]GGK86412.1 transporter [Rufibacter glacialis]
MNKKHLLLGLLLTLVARFSYAQTQPQGRILSLQEALTFATSNNIGIKQSQLDEESAEYRIKETKGSGLPQVNGVGQLSVFPSIPTQILPGEIIGKPGTTVPVQFGTKYNANGGLELSQLIFSKSYFVGLEAAATTRDLYRLRTQMSQEDVIYNVSTAYLMTLQTKEQFGTIEANYNRLVQLEKILTLQYKNDFAKKVDVSRITVNRTNLENQRQSLAAAYEQQKNALKFFMGMPMEQDFEIADSTTLASTALPLSTDASEVLSQRVDYKLLQTQGKLYGLNVENIKGRAYPALAGFGQYTYQAQRNEFNFFDTTKPWFNTFVLGVRLSVPIFDGFQRKNQIKQAQLQVSRVELDMKNLELATQMRLDNALKQISTSQLAIQNQERNVELAREVYNTTNSLYKEGLSPLTDLLEAEAALRVAQTSLNNDRLTHKIAQLDYIRARGELKNLIN